MVIFLNQILWSVVEQPRSPFNRVFLAKYQSIVDLTSYRLLQTKVPVTVLQHPLLFIANVGGVKKS